MAVFVGRQHEREELGRGLTSALQGEGRLFLVSGEGGIGKTRLSEELARDAAQGGAAVLWGRCWESGGAPAYWPWVQLLRAALRTPVLNDIAGRPEAADIAHLIPEMSAPGAPLSPDGVDAEHARFRLFDAVATLFRRAAAERPLVLILDDLHASDTDSLLLLRFLAREVSGFRWFLLGTFRPSEAQGNPAVADILADLLRDSTHVPLGGLSRGDVVEYIDSAIEGLSIDRRELPAPSVVGETVYAITEGNPFFLGEIIRLWIAEGFRSLREAASGDLRVPDQVRVAIRRRLRLLPAEVRELVQAASVIGREFDLRLLERLAERLPSQGMEEAMALACRGGVLDIAAGAPSRFAFSHMLIRDTLYHDLSAAERAARHRGVAKAMIALYGDDDEHLEDIAHHFCEAAVGGDSSEALRYTSRAASRAVRLRAYADAVLHYRRALEVLDRRSGGAEQSRWGERCRLLLALGDTLNASGQSNVARATYLEAAEAARRSGAVEDLAEAALGYGGGWLRLIEPEQDTDSPGPAPLGDTLSRLLEEALAALGEADHPLRARALARLAVQLYFNAPADHCARLAREGLAVARRCGDPLTLASVLSDAIVAIWHLDTAEERREMAEEALKIGIQLGDPAVEGVACTAVVGTLFDLGDCEPMNLYFDRYRRLTEYYRQPMHLWGLKVHTAMRAMVTGCFDEAEQLMKEALDQGEAARGLAPAVYWFQQCALQRERGQLDELAAGEAVLKWSAESMPAFPELRLQLAHVYLLLGRLSEARQELDAVAVGDFAIIRRDQRWANALCEATEVCVGLGDRQCAAVLYRLLEPYAPYNALGVGSAVSWGSVSRSVGRLASLLEDWPAAERYFEMSLARHRDLNARPWLARTRYAYAEMLTRARPHDLSRARELAEEALSSAKAMGMQVLVSDTEALLQRLAAPPKAAERAEAAPAASGENIFRREGDYWAISFAGTTLRLRHSAGLAFIAHLLRYPGQECHVIDMVAIDVAGRRAARAEPGASPPPELGDAGELLDAEAKAAYRRRLGEVRRELAEAEEMNDPGAAERARAELEFLSAELSRAVGLGGRDRKAASASERARVNVTRAVALAMKRLAEQHPPLAEHLTRTIRTGTFCIYAPDPRLPIRWDS